MNYIRESQSFISFSYPKMKNPIQSRFMVVKTRIRTFPWL